MFQAHNLSDALLAEFYLQSPTPSDRIKHSWRPIIWEEHEAVIIQECSKIQQLERRESKSGMITNPQSWLTNRKRCGRDWHKKLSSYRINRQPTKTVPNPMDLSAPYVVFAHVSLSPCHFAAAEIVSESSIPPRYCRKNNLNIY